MAGDYFIGERTSFDVGSNNLSTEVSGMIADGGLRLCGPGASLIKIGTGTLITVGKRTRLPHGPTTVNVGSLIVNGSIAASSRSP